MTDTLPFFIVLAASVLVSLLMRRLHVPWVIALIAGGVIIGPFGFELLTIDPTLEFFSDIGLVFLMFMAGLESQLSVIRKYESKIVSLAAVNGLIPAAIGVGAGIWLGLDMSTSVLLGIIFMSTSVAVIVPVVESTGMIHSRLGKIIIGATVLEDLVSLLLLSILLQVFQPVAAIPLWLLYPLLISLIPVLRWLTPRIRKLIGPHTVIERQLFQQDLRVIIAILIGTVLVFELLGLHAVVGAFFAGFILSDSIHSDTLKHKLQSISYGIFIPMFFVLLGVAIDFSTFLDPVLLRITLLIAALSIVAKFFTGIIGGKLIGFTTSQSYLVGSSSIPQLSTPLAAVITGVEAGLFAEDFIPVIVGLTVLTTLVGPLLMRLFINRYQAAPS